MSTVTLLLQAERAVESMQLNRARWLVDSLEVVAPGIPETKLVVAKLQAAAGDLEGAQSTYEALLRSGFERQGVRQNAGEIAFRRTQFRKSLELFQAEAVRYPAVLPLHASGAALDRLGQADSARAAYERALEMDPSYAPAERSLTRWYEQEGEYDLALIHIENALRLDPENPEYRSTRGLLLGLASRDEEAVTVLRSVLEENPTDYSAELALSRSLRKLGDEEGAERHAQLAERKREVMSEIERLRDAVRALPENDRDRLALANRLRDVRLYDEAIRHYAVLEDRLKKNLTISGNLATLYLQKGDTTEALRRYDRILQIDSTHVETWLNLGFYYARLDRRREALEAWGKAEKYDPNHPGVQALQRMARERVE